MEYKEFLTERTKDLTQLSRIDRRTHELIRQRAGRISNNNVRATTNINTISETIHNLKQDRAERINLVKAPSAWVKYWENFWKVIWVDAK